MKHSHSAGYCILILHFGTFLGHWTDQAARTGKCGLPVGSSCGPSAHKFPLTLVKCDRGREPRIPSASSVHARTGAGTGLGC